jgi:hypothetical protein
VYTSVTPSQGAAVDVSWQIGNARTWEALTGHHSADTIVSPALEELKRTVGACHFLRGTSS